MIPTSGRSGVYSATFPTSGMTLSGAAYGLPTWEPAMAGSVCSSSPGVLPTPSANIADNGGTQHPDKRRAGGHQPSIADVIEHL